MAKSAKPLNNKTPKWFQDWHRDYYIHTDNRSKRNEKLLYVILGAMLTAYVVGSANVDLIDRIARAFSG